MDPLLVIPRRADSGRGLLLETVQNVNGFGEPDGIDRPIGVASVVLDDFENAGAFAFPRLGHRRFSTDLHQVERIPEIVDHLGRKFEQVVFRRPDPMKRLFWKRAFHHDVIIPNWVCLGEKNSRRSCLASVEKCIEDAGWRSYEQPGGSVAGRPCGVNRYALDPA